MYSIIRNPFYYDKLLYKEEVLEGKQLHIIEKELFDKVQANLKPFKKSDWNHRSRTSIAKFFTCGSCGGTIIEWHKRRKLKPGGCRLHIYFRCSKFKQPSCLQPSITYFNLIEQLINLLNMSDISKICFPQNIQKEILDYSFINSINAQNQNNVILLLRSQNQTFSEVDENTVKAYLRYVILRKETQEKTELLEILKIRFSLKDKLLSIRTKSALK